MPGADLLLRDSWSRGVADTAGRFMALKDENEPSTPSFSFSPIYANPLGMCEAEGVRACLETTVEGFGGGSGGMRGGARVGEVKYQRGIKRRGRGIRGNEIG